MLARYRIHRGKRPPDDPLPEGVRQDTRRHTKHPLRPSRDMVEEYLAEPTESAWRRFEQEYLALLEERFASDRGPFDHLADLARKQDVFLGCSCPTKKNPRVDHCHTYPALQFMMRKYPDLDVRLPLLPH